uniref:SLAM family member 7 n=1 Tax=Lonchura striata TaxID=40157 RepID=UPI000B4DD999|nr:SLAM family member 7 [Lonchura striata domestica]
MAPNPLRFWMPMDVSWIPLLTILMHLQQTVSASNTKEVVGVLGGSVTFHSHNRDKKAAFWIFENDPIVTVPFGNSSPPIFSDEKFKTHFAVSENGRALSISPLRMEDAGIYSVKINGKISTFILQVFRELAEPTVTCEAQNCSGGICSFSLRCSARGAGFGNVSYTWRVRDRLRAEGSVLPWGNGSARDEPEALTCLARNAVSSRNVTVTTPGVLCNGALSSSQAGAGLRVGLGVTAVVVAVVLLSVSSLFFRRSKAATAEYTTVYAEVGSPQPRVPTGAKAEPADGGSPKTVYSLVKRPEQVGWADDGTAENATRTVLELV